MFGFSCANMGMVIPVHKAPNSKTEHSLERMALNIFAKRDDFIIFVFCKYFNLLIFEKFGHGDAPVILIYTYYIYTSRKFCGNLCFAGMDALEVLFNPFFSTN